MERDKQIHDVSDKCEHRCKRTKCRRRTVTVTAWPNVLVLHFKRWLPTIFPGVFMKGRRKVVFPVTLTDAHVPWVNGIHYILRSVLVHHGDAGGGHYTTFCRDNSGNWYHHDDSVVRQTNFEETTTVEATMLFYERAS